MVNMKSLLAVFVLVILDTLCVQGQNPFTCPLVVASEESRGFQEDEENLTCSFMLKNGFNKTNFLSITYKSFLLISQHMQRGAMF